jgi:hypothetical protein
MYKVMAPLDDNTESASGPKVGLADLKPLAKTSVYTFAERIIAKENKK